MKQTFKQWETKDVNDLPDSSFAFIDSGGSKDSKGKTTPSSFRHLPYKDKDGKTDLPHVRNALARLSDTKIPDSAKPSIKRKLEAILEKAKASNKYVGMMPFEFDAMDGEPGEDAATAIPSMIHLIPMGQWDHDMYGPITINASDIREFVQNFNANVRKGVFITAGHEGFTELPAQGWVTAVESRDDGLWGKVEWNDLGIASLSDKQYKFFSPEFYRDYEDPQTHQIYRNVLTGGALTKSPYFKELTALVASDSILFKSASINRFSEQTMDLQALLSKDIETLSADEKAFIKTNAAQLTDEQKALHTAIIDEPTVAEPEPVAVVETVAAVVAEPEAVAQASEKVMVTASELAALRIKANEGAQAFAELAKRDIAAEVSKMVFSNSNKEGRFLPKSTDTLRTFMEGLNPAQRTAFSSIVTELPEIKAIFSEAGDAGATEGTAQKEVEAKTNAIMASDKLSYSDALKCVMSENPALSTRYDNEINGRA